MDNILLYPIILPILFGIVCIVLPKKTVGIKSLLSVLCAMITFILSLLIFLRQPLKYIYNDSLILRVDHLSGFILLAAGLFGLLIAIYSISFMAGKSNQGTYYTTFLWTLGATCGVLLSNHLILLLMFWGFLGITLYLLILTGGEDTAPAAKKALIIIGGSDALILLGICLIYSLTGTFEMDKINLIFKEISAYFAFILLLLGVFAKIGAVPLHTWIPDVSAKAPIPVLAFLPGSIDKLLGIYLLFRLCINLFQKSVSLNYVLIIIGTLSIIYAVIMALKENNARKILAYLVISGSGYILLGFGIGNSIGLAGGLFYMISSAIWTFCLFLCIGNVEYRTGTAELNRLGGLIKSMPMTFGITLVAVLSISGAPLFSGFASKWLIYQGLIDIGRNGSKIFTLWLVMAMFGSALTFAIGMKMIHSIFLGVPSRAIEPMKKVEVGIFMSFPMFITAILCVIFGIFINAVPLKYFILPSVSGISFLGIWSAGQAAYLIIFGLIIGSIIYFAGKIQNIRTAENFIGGERLLPDERVDGTQFYNTVEEMKLMHRFYVIAEKKWFDIYNQGNQIASGITKLFRKAHTGILTLYMSWIILGLIVLLILMLRI